MTVRIRRVSAKRSAIVVVAVLGCVSVGSWSMRNGGLPWSTDARADPFTELLELREAFATFDTLFVHLRDDRVCGGGPEGTGEKCHGVLRMDRATGRATYDDGPSARFTWDGTHLWFDLGRLDAVELGPAADAITQIVVGELFSGFADSTIVRQQADDWPPYSRMAGGTFLVDLPGAWDDPYAVLFQVSAPDSVGFAVTVLDRSTGEVVESPIRGVRLERMAVPPEFDVRLESDLDEVESIDSRSVVVQRDPFGQVAVATGPAYLPPYHELSTRMPLTFDPDASSGTVVAGIERPYKQFGPVACSAAGTSSALVDLEFVVDPAHEYYAYLADAVDAGCPIRLGVGVATTVNLQGPASTAVQVQVVARSGPTVLGSEAVEGAAQGPASFRKGVVRTIAVEQPVDADALRLTLQGSVSVTCPGEASGANLMRVGVVEELRPTVAWDGCFPEYGTTPDPDSLRPLFEEETSPL